MKANKAEQQALISLLNRIYGDIRAIEDAWNIRIDKTDFRPRIEYFHDAVRALTSDGSTGYERTGRLTVEYLAYDISMLRHIQANPLSKSTANLSQSPGTSLVVRPEGDVAGKGTASVKGTLSELYKSYSVLFAALLSEPADRNYYNRVSECNSEVENLAALEDELKAAQKKGGTVDIAALADQHIDDPDLMRKVIAAAGGGKKKMQAQEAFQKVKDIMSENDKTIKTIEKAHFTFAMSQLAVYENSRDVVKKMAQEGMNIVGNFVESAVREATRGGGQRR